MGELSSSLPDELNFLLRGRAPGKRQVKPVSIEKAQASLQWVKGICGDDEDEEADPEEFVAENIEDDEIEEEASAEEEEEDEDEEEEDGENLDSNDEDANNLETAETSKPVVSRSVKVTETDYETAPLPAGLGFLLKTRAPGKRKVKPVSAEKAAMLAEFGGSDDDDQDFSIGDIKPDDDDDNSEDSSDSSYSPVKKKGSKKKNDESDNSSFGSDVEITKEERVPIHIDLDTMENASSMSSKAAQEVVTASSGPRIETLVCLVCLKDNNDDRDNELVQCDGCGVACHVLCYGIGECSDDGDAHSGRSTPLSTASTEPWFCDSCRAGTGKPSCQLCPNDGGAFKQTDSGHWVHLVCALYTGCSFGEVGGLSRVNVNTIKQKQWGSRVCSLCPDPQLASTGVCISCDAGMCRMIFHVTCAQREGLLADAPVAVAASVLSSSMQSPIKLPRAHRNDYSSDEEAKKRKPAQAAQEAADPFYACCKRHSNPESTKRNKRNFLAAVRICSTFKQEDRWELAIGRDRYERKLDSARERFVSRTRKQVRAFQSSLTMALTYQSRPLTSCPAAVKRALLKAKLGGVEEEHFVMSPTASSSAAVSSAHYAPLSFTSRFIQYFEARNRRIEELLSQCRGSETLQTDVAREEAELKKTYDALFQNVRRQRDLGDRHAGEVAEIHSCVTELLNKYFKTKGDQDFVFTVPPLPSAITAANDRKQFENDLKETAGITMNECSACKQTRDQHMMMQCDTCKRHYHCFCLDPPLSQPWIGSKTARRSSAKWSWECHFCCPSSSDNDVVRTDINVDAPRRLRREIKAPVRFIVSSEDAVDPAVAASKPSTASNDTNGRSVQVHKGGGLGSRASRKRSRAVKNGSGTESAAEANGGKSSVSPARKHGKQQSPEKLGSPSKLLIPSISVAALLKSPPKATDPGVYDFSSDSNA